MKYFLYKLKQTNVGSILPPVDDNRVNLGLCEKDGYYLGRALDEKYINEIPDFVPVIIDDVIAIKMLKNNELNFLNPNINQKIILLEKIIFKIFRCICDNENINSFDLKNEFYAELMEFEELQNKEIENGLLYDVAIQKLDGQLLTVEGKE